MTEYFSKASYSGDPDVSWREGWTTTLDIADERYSSEYDASIHAQKFLSAILRIERLNHAGALTNSELIDILRGVDVDLKEANNIKTYGTEAKTPTWIIYMVYEALKNCEAIHYRKKTVSGPFGYDAEMPYLPQTSTWKEILRGNKKLYLSASRIRKMEFSMANENLKKTLCYEEENDRGGRPDWLFRKVTDDLKKRANAYYSLMNGETSFVAHLISIKLIQDPLI